MKKSEGRRSQRSQWSGASRQTLQFETSSFHTSWQINQRYMIQASLSSESSQTRWTISRVNQVNQSKRVEQFRLVIKRIKSNKLNQSSKLIKSIMWNNSLTVRQSFHDAAVLTVRWAISGILIVVVVSADEISKTALTIS